MKKAGFPVAAGLATALVFCGLAAASAQTASPPPPRYLAAEAAAGATWPHTLSRNGASITIYQPQAISWPDRRTLTARAAVAITPAGQHQPILGTLEISLATSTDAANGVVHLSDPKLIGSHFPALDTKQAARLETRISAALPEMQTRQVPLSAVLLSLKQLPVGSVPVDNAAPAIFYSARPASLVAFDGQPVLAPIGKTGISFAVNTNWDVFVAGGTWYLLNNGVWFSAAAAAGPYAPVRHLPAAFNALPNNFTVARKAIPARPPQAANQVPTIFVSMNPAEIIVTGGPPHFVPVPNTGLQRVANTPSALFFDTAQGRFYVLFSGRWFSAAGLEGPWEFATDRLPPDFVLIPRDGQDGSILAAVPGTVAAQEAVLRAQIPTTATLKRATAKLTVMYAGPPRFVPIARTSILHAVNTRTVVLLIGRAYYACESGAWFVARSPAGPWALADSIPVVIRTIPVSSPLYYVTYVHVYAATPTAVSFGYTAGYTMAFVSAGVLVYGTGYYYPPLIVPGPVPIFYPYPYTYGAGVYYNPASAAWARGGTVYGAYGGAASGARYYNPTTGAWAQGGAVYGPYGGAFSAYNPSTGSYAHGSAVWGNGSGTANASYYNAHTGVSGSTNQNANAYSRWGSSSFTGPNQTVHTQSRGNAQGSAGGFSSSTGATGGAYHNKVTGSSGGAVKTANGDVYAGRDGNVYQHSSSGWSKWNNGGWNQVQPPSNSHTRQQGSSLGGTQAGQGSTSRNTMDRSSYQQLEQDRLGRRAGQGGFGGLRNGGWGGGGIRSGGRRLRG